MLALKWEDPDWPGRIIRVRRPVYPGKVDETKTAKSKGDIPLGKTVPGALWALRLSDHKHGEYLLSTGRAKLYTPRVFERSDFEPIRKSRDLPPLSWCSFRRAGTTVLHEDDMPFKVQQDVMRHTTPEMSLRCTKAETGSPRRAINRLDQVMFGMKGASLFDAIERNVQPRLQNELVN